MVRIDPRTQLVEEIGRTLEHEEINHTKWQNGFMGKVSARRGGGAPPHRKSNMKHVRTCEPPFHGEMYVAAACAARRRAQDGCVYGIPLCGRNVLRVHLATQTVTTVGGPFPQLGQWEGGVVDRDGTLFCMPLCSKFVLRIAPRALPPAAGGSEGAAARAEPTAPASGIWADGKAHD